MIPAAGGLLGDLAALSKLRISLLSAVSAAAGFLAASRAVRPPLAAALAGTFLLAAGAAALNEVIDRDRDARMDRTRGRPIPSGRIGVPAALALAALAAGLGAAFLGLGAGATPALLGVGALLWYDAVYTPLKRVTAFAVAPGALVGALPPAIGWTAAGGALGDARLHALCAFFLLWQVPHFWLLAARHAGDFERGGLPTPASRFSPAQAGRITAVWAAAMACSVLLLPLFGVTRGAWSSVALLGAALAVAAAPGRLALEPLRPERLRGALAAVNLFAVAMLAIVLADALLAR